MMEDVAERLFGRLLPRVEAQAGCTCQHEHLGCCGPTGGQWAVNYVCRDANGWVCSSEFQCIAHCPT